MNPWDAVSWLLWLVLAGPDAGIAPDATPPPPEDDEAIIEQLHLLEDLEMLQDLDLLMDEER